MHAEVNFESCISIYFKKVRVSVCVSSKIIDLNLVVRGVFRGAVRGLVRWVSHQDNKMQGHIAMITYPVFCICHNPLIRAKTTET